MFEGCEIDEQFKNGVESVLKTHGYRITKGKIRQKVENFTMSPYGPWVFIRGMDNRQCGKWGVYHDHFKFWPMYCATQCWKVVVRVMTVRDLHTLYGIAKALNFPGKVGINKRGYVKGPYLGFFYSESEEEAKEQYKEIRKHLEEHLEDFDISYKQSCTEMEITGVKPNPLLEKKCDCAFEFIEDENASPAWHASMVMNEWEQFARMIGDETATYKGNELKTYEAHQQRGADRIDNNLQQ